MKTQRTVEREKILNVGLAAVVLTGAVASVNAQMPPEKICASARLNPGDPYDIFCMNPDGTELFNLTAEVPGDARNPLISRDGERIAFSISYDGIWLCDGAGCGRIPGTEDRDWPLAWFDEDTLLYSPLQTVICTREVWMIDLDGSNDCTLIPTPFLGQREYDIWNFHVSPLGDEILSAWQSGCNAYSADVYIVDLFAPCAPGTAGGHLLYGDPGDSRNDESAVWTSDAMKVCWLHEPVPGTAQRIIMCKDRGTGQVVTLPHPLTGMRMGAISPDDQYLLFSTTGDPAELLKLNLDTGGVEDPPVLVADFITSSDWGYLSCSVLPCSIVAVTYDGDSLLSTEGSAMVEANLVATLRDAEGGTLGIDGEAVTFTLTAEGVGTIVATATSVDGVASVTQSLEPAIYDIEITLESSDIVGYGMLVVYNPEGGFATGGGWIVPEDDGLNTHPNARANFGFNAKYKQGSPTGHIEFRYSDSYIDLKGDSVERLVITGGSIAQFKGWATVNGTAGYWFFVKAIDNNDPGVGHDVFDIKIWAPESDPNGDLTERAGGVLSGGNIVVHAR